MTTIAKPLLLDETYKEGNAALINILENITAAKEKAAEAAASADVATQKADIATAKADAANTSATNAAQSYTNADAIATQLTEYLATKETLTAPAVDKTLLIEGAAADSKVVGELKSDYISIEKDVIKYLPIDYRTDFIIASISSTGANLASTTRIRSGFTKYPVGTKFTIDSGFKFRVYFYSSTDTSTFIADSASEIWKTTDYTINQNHSNYYARLLVAKTDDSTISDSNIAKDALHIAIPPTVMDIPAILTYKQNKKVLLGINSIDIENPASYNASLWSYSDGVWTFTNNDSDNLTFDVNVPEAGEYTIMFRARVTSGQGSVTLRDSSNTTLRGDSFNAPYDNVYRYVYNFASAGTYRLKFTGSSATSSGSYSDIMFAKGELKSYTPYSKSVDESVIESYLLKNDVEVIQRKVDSNTEIADYNLSALKIYENDVKDVDADIKIPVMTDCHTDSVETYEMLYHMANSGAVEFCINLGDYISRYYDSLDNCVKLFKLVTRGYNTIPTKVDVHLLKGNHDNNVVGNNDPNTYVNNAMFYNQTDWRYKHITGQTNKAYGYVDVEHAKIRVVMLDTADIYDTDGTRLSGDGEVQMLQPQFSWFVNEALDFSGKSNPTDWEVIIFSHSYLAGICKDGFIAVLNAFQNGTRVNGSFSSNSANYLHTLTADKDYSAQGGIRVICTVSGHHHIDKIIPLETDNPIDEVLVACENQDAFYYNANNERIPYIRTKGTILEHCIETVCVNKSNKTVTFKRLGIGNDRSINY